jgi:hypothetical protein
MDIETEITTAIDGERAARQYDIDKAESVQDRNDAEEILQGFEADVPLLEKFLPLVLAVCEPLPSIEIRWKKVTLGFPSGADKERLKKDIKEVMQREGVIEEGDDWYRDALMLSVDTKEIDHLIVDFA